MFRQEKTVTNNYLFWPKVIFLNIAKQKITHVNTCVQHVFTLCQYLIRAHYFPSFILPLVYDFDSWTSSCLCCAGEERWHHRAPSWASPALLRQHGQHEGQEHEEVGASCVSAAAIIGCKTGLLSRPGKRGPVKRRAWHRKTSECRCYVSDPVLSHRGLISVYFYVLASQLLCQCVG